MSKCHQISPNVIFFHQMWAWGPCSVTRHWSRHWNSGNDRLPGLLWGVLFQLSQCPHVLTYSFFFDGSYSKLPLFSARSPSPRGWPWCWLPRCPLASDPSCRSRTWSAPAGPWTGSFNQFLTPLSEWQRMSGWWITKSVEVFFGGQVIIPARFGSEVIFYWRNPSTDSLLRIVTSRDNWWDNTFYKISCNADSRNILMDINS